MARSTSVALRCCFWLAALPALAGFAYVLGRLKLSYYFGTFGVDLPPSIATGDLLYESWFVLQNTLFVMLLWWIALKTREVWVSCVAVFHALLPIVAHYAFLSHERALAAWLIDYRHTLLKLLLFVVLILVWLFHPARRAELRRLTPPLPPAGMALFAIVLFAWGISAAKHFGSYDANLAMLRPDDHLMQVTLYGQDGNEIGDPAATLYLIHAGPEWVIVWDPGEFRYGISRVVRILSVPAKGVKRWEGRRGFGVQPGGRFL